MTDDLEIVDRVRLRPRLAEAGPKGALLKRFALTLALLLAAFTLAGLLGARGRDRPAPDDTTPDSFTLNALDYRLNIYDLRGDHHGISRQYDERLREYIGDILFADQELSVIENDRYTGHFLPLGEEKKPDTEFALFHSLRIYKRTFQVRQFPFLDRHIPYPAIEPNSFFGNIRDPQTSVRLGIGQVYLLRLYHRTTVGDERVFLLKVVELTPGVKATMLWRELENSREP